MTSKQALIVSHHIGGRGGTGCSPFPAPFVDDVHQVYYDADSDCIEQIAARPDQGRVTVLPLCIGKEDGSCSFNIDYDPCMSSMRELNPEYGDYTLFQIDPIKGAMDYRLADTGRTMEKRKLQVVSLDTLYADDKPPAPPPDFLSMDTQGSEYDILLGATQVLADSVLALRLEVAFQPIYKGQKLFGDLCQLVAVGVGVVETSSDALMLRTWSLGLLAIGMARFARLAK